MTKLPLTAGILPAGDSPRVVELIAVAHKLKDINYKSACVKADEALYLARQIGSDSLLKPALALSALLDWYDGRHKLALGKTRERLKLAVATHDTLDVANSYTQIGLIYLYTSDYDSSLKYNDLALVNFMAINDTLNIVKTHGFKGIIYMNRGDYLQAKENLLVTVAIKRKAKSISWNVLQIAKDAEVGEKYYYEALERAKEDMLSFAPTQPPTVAKRWATYNLGLAYLNLGMADSALIKFKEANAIARSFNMDVYWNEESKAYVQLGYYDSAILASKRALADAVDHGTRISQSFSYRKIGEANLLKGDFTRALKAFSQNLLLDKAMGHRYSQMETLQFMAESALSLQELALAEKYINMSLAIAAEIGAKVGIVSALKLASAIQKAYGNYKEAMLLEHDHDVLWNQLHAAKTVLDLAKLDLLHDIDKQRQEIAELNQQNALSQSMVESRTLVMTIVIVVAAFIAALLLINFFRTRKLMVLNRQLSSQQAIINGQNIELANSNKEKEILLGEIHHRVKNNLQVISSLLSMQQLQLGDNAARQAVMEGQSRVQTMGLIHESLYQHDNFSEIAMQSYLEKLVENLIKGFGYRQDEIDLAIDAHRLTINVDIAINIGLIANELISNALKYAFANHDDYKALQVELKKAAPDTLLLRIKDNGKQQNINFEGSNNFGLKLVKQLVKKYGGKLDMDSADGVEIRVYLNIRVLNG